MVAGCCCAWVVAEGLGTDVALEPSRFVVDSLLRGVDPALAGGVLARFVDPRQGVGRYTLPGSRLDTAALVWAVLAAASGSWLSAVVPVVPEGVSPLAVAAAVVEAVSEEALSSVPVGSKDWR